MHRLIIVLGHRLTPDGQLTSTLQARLRAAASVYVHNIRNRISTRIMVTGGRVQKKTVHTEAYMMKRHLIRTYGIHPNHILVEPCAQNTIDNALFTKRIVRHHTVLSYEDPIIVITSAFHMKRAKTMFETIWSEGHTRSCTLKYRSVTNQMSPTTLRQKQKHEMKHLRIWKKNNKRSRRVIR